MNAWQILRYSVRQIARNGQQVLRLSLLPFVIAQCTLLFVFWRARSRAVEDINSAIVSWIAPFSVPDIMVVALSHAICSIWIAVAWHRFLLRDEPATRALPPLHIGRMTAYFLACLGMLIALGVALLLANAAVLTLPALMGGFVNVPPLLAAMAMLLVFVPCAVVLLRAMTALPGIAAGDADAVGTAWNATRGQWRTFLALILAYLAVGGGFWSIGFYVSSLSTVATVILALSIYWINLAIGISLLTTLYDHYARGRPLY